MIHLSISATTATAAAAAAVAAAAATVGHRPRRRGVKHMLGYRVRLSRVEKKAEGYALYIISGGTKYEISQVTVHLQAF